jgi:hypothetical protein
MRCSGMPLPILKWQLLRLNIDALGFYGMSVSSVTSISSEEPGRVWNGAPQKWHQGVLRTGQAHEARHHEAEASLSAHASKNESGFGTPNVLFPASSRQRI